MDLLRAAVFLLACASAMFAVATVGGAFSDRLDVLTHFTPFYFAGGLVALALTLLIGSGPGGRESLFFAVVAIVLPATTMAPDFWAALAAPRAPATGRTLKIVQFNVWHDNVDPAGTAAWIAGQQADIVVMEEASDRGAEIAQALDRLYPFQTRCLPHPLCATLILSKAKPTAAGAFLAPNLDRLHSGGWARFEDDQGGYTVVGTHLAWPLPAGEQQADAQRLATEISRFDRRTLILAGDFNSTPWSFTLRRLGAEFGLIRRTHALFTWPARTYGGKLRLSSPIALLPIDHVFAGEAWKTVSVKRGPRLGSDHFPVVAILTRG